MSQFFVSFARATAGLCGLCIATVSGIVAYYLWIGAHWINLESTHSERQLYESNPPNPLWLDLAYGFPFYIPAIVFAGITITILISLALGFRRETSLAIEEPTNSESGRRRILTPAPHTTGHTDP